MNIDKLNENTGSLGTHKTVGISAIRRQTVVERDSASGDQVDMSMIGQLMARSLRVLADSDAVRPEVLAKHQPLPRQNGRFDDQAIDRIFCRMQGP